MPISAEVRLRPPSASQPLADGFHHDDVQAAASRFDARASGPTTIRPSRAAVLVKVNEFWISLPEPQPARVGRPSGPTISATATSCWVERLMA